MGKLEGLLPVVGEQLGAVLGPIRRDGLQPLGRPPVLVRPRRPRQLPVGHITDQHVAEGVLMLPSHRRVALPAQERSSVEGVQTHLERERLTLGHGRQCPQPADRAEHSRIL
jgi:hypothetical protein